ncbi:MAG: diaminopimelate decarboxylase [Bdellovibrionaceae bacterium]|nr:diaminopimelate decarboxylase [Bdellovibrio sp.]
MSRKLFTYQGTDLHFGPNAYPLKSAVKNYQQPIWLYDLAIIEERVRWIQSWPQLGRLHYAMKANFNLDILKLFKKLNCGLDVVSVGEMKHALKAGFTGADFIFSGVAKSRAELAWAIENEIYQINVESFSELKRIIDIANQQKKIVSVDLRVNPEVDAETHPSIATALKDSKFGLDFPAAQLAIDLIAQNKCVQLKALSFHLGSQIMNVKVFEKALTIMKPFYQKAKSICPELDRFDLGGGLGIDYKNADSAIDQQRWDELAALFSRELKAMNAFLLLEMGRFLVARSSVLIARVEIIKEVLNGKKFMILDAGMSLLMRPALYQAYHEILPIYKRGEETETYDIVGPICESTDVLMLNKKFSKVEEGDFVAICDTGAYGAAMTSRYNLREESAEIFI